MTSYSKQDQDFIDEINEFCDNIHKINMERGWWHDPVTGQLLKGHPLEHYVVATKLALIFTELAEALEGVRKDEMDDKLPHRYAVEVELADAFIRIGDLAGMLSLDLGGAIIDKLAYNRTRLDHDMSSRQDFGGKRF